MADRRRSSCTIAQVSRLVDEAESTPELFGGWGVEFYMGSSRECATTSTRTLGFALGRTPAGRSGLWLLASRDPDLKGAFLGVSGVMELLHRRAYPSAAHAQARRTGQRPASPVMPVEVVEIVERKRSEKHDQPLSALGGRRPAREARCAESRRRLLIWFWSPRPLLYAQVLVMSTQTLGRERRRDFRVIAVTATARRTRSNGRLRRVGTRCAIRRLPSRDDAACATRR
jgi:hypothetical protein